MQDPRPEKVAVVEEVRERLDGSDAVLLTEYRGINVSEMGDLRRALREAGGDYKIYKNTLVRFAARDLGLDIEDLLVGPTAIAFVPGGGDADPVVVAKVLREFSKSNPNLVVKGGLLGTRVLTVDEVKGLAEVAPREVLLARLAGLLAAPLQQFAGLLQAVPRDFAYGLQALIDKGGSESAAAPPAQADVADASPDPDASLDASADADADPDPDPEPEPDPAQVPDPAPAAQAEATDDTGAAGVPTEES